MMKKTETRLRAMAAATACGALALGSLHCAADTQTEAGDLTEVLIGAGQSKVLSLRLDEETPLVVTVDCGVPEGVDLMGNQIEVQAESMGAPSGPARAAFWQWAGVVEPGVHEVTVTNASPELASCGVSVRRQASEPSAQTCSSYSIHRSTIYDATHLRLGDTDGGEWESLPASGNHWGTWAHWGKVYGEPVLRGYYLHNLEHGGMVLSYKCASADESEECAAAEASLIELANAFGQNRVIVTPDPDQPDMFAVRAWRWAYSSDCLDEASALDFMKSTFRRGREDIEGDPPYPFDPTSTEDVPCENLMAAPDSC